MSIILSKSEKTTAAVLTNVRAAMRSSKVYAAFVAEHGVTTENVNDYAAALAVHIAPEGPQTKVVDGVKVRTTYGNALNTAKTGLKAVLGTDEKPATTPDWMALIITAVDNGVTNNLNASDIRDAVAKHVESLLAV